METHKLAPIIIFAFNRPKALQRLVDSLSHCNLFEQSKVIMFVDGPRNKNDEKSINEVIAIGSQLTDDVRISHVNRGLGESIIAGVSQVMKVYGKAIVLEDDLVLMPRFLQFMNEALVAYEKDHRILSVCGYSLKVHCPKGYKNNIYLSDRSSSWGWATWYDRWDKVDWQVKNWESIKTDKLAQRAFNRAGSDMFYMLSNYMEGKNKSWAIRFCYHQHSYNLWAVHPLESLVDNEGFGNDATNCRQSYSRFKVVLDRSNSHGSWHFDEPLQPNQKILRQLHFYHSILLRIYSKIRNLMKI